MTSERLPLPDGKDMDVLIARASSEPRGAVILLSPIFGVDGDFQDIAENWAEAGYAALAPDYYHRAGGGALPRDADGFRDAVARWKRWDAAHALEDLRIVCARGRALAGAGPLGVVGYCAGGELAARAAIAGLADGYAVFHAARLDRYADALARVDAPMTLHFGGADRMVPPEQVAAVSSAVADNPAIEVFVHPGADHGYTFARQPSFHEAAARSSFDRALKMLARAKAEALA